MKKPTIDYFQDTIDTRYDFDLNSYGIINTKCS